MDDVVPNHLSGGQRPLNERPKRTHVGYCRPPIEHRIQPGEVRNPRGRPRSTAGATLREWVNELMSSDIDAVGLRSIADDEREKPAKRIAASRILIALRAGTLKDFTPFLAGEKTLEELHSEGVNTSVVKKARVTAKGDRELELHDGGVEYDRLVNSTELTPADLEKNRRIDEGKATEVLAYQPPQVRELELPDFLKNTQLELPPPRES